MISEAVMPQMGADMEEGTIVRWMKKEGDAVERGEIIAEIETDKANVEIEAFESGSFAKVIVPEGETVKVGTVIAVIASPGEDLSSYQPATAAEAPAAREQQAAAPAAQRVEAASAPSPVGAEPARERASVDAPVDGRVRASPVARKLAEQRGIDIRTLRGTGPDGRIVKRDVEAAATGAAAPAEQSARPAGDVRAVPMTRMRQTIARRMTQSKQQAPHYYITMDVDMSDAERLRKQINDASPDDLHLSVNDLIVKACAGALRRHPIFNSWFVDGAVQQHAAINICVGIALEDGLIAPAILDCGAKSLVDISAAARNLIERARGGALKPDEYAAGTFTISNLGMFGVETLVAIIQPPQAAILGVGSIRDEPVVRDGQVAIAKLVKVALSGDHRVTDGAQGAQFLAEIRKLLESPALLLLETA